MRSSSPARSRAAIHWRRSSKGKGFLSRDRRLYGISWELHGHGLTRIILGLFSLLQLYARRDRLPIAQNFHVHDVSYLAAAQGVGEIVEILNGLVAELDENVSRPQPGFGCGGIGLHVGELYAILSLAEVGDRAKIWTVPSASTTGRRLIFRDNLEGGLLLRVRQLQRNALDHVEQAGRRRSIDLVPGVRRLVIVGVQSGKEKQHRDFLRHKRSVVARRISARRVFDFEGLIFLSLLEHSFEGGSCTYSADVDFVVPNAADHVHIDHGDRFGERPRGLLDPLRGAKQAELFSREVHE